MTGYGRGIAEADGVRVAIELRSVNHRFLDLKARGTSLLGSAAADRVDKLIKKVIKRGSVSMSARVSSPQVGARVRIDLAAARRVIAELRKLEALGARGGLDARVVLEQPGVLVSDADDDAPDAALADLALRAAQDAVAALDGMRQSEGAALSTDLSGRLERLGEIRIELAEHGARTPEDLRRRLEDRVGKLLQGAGIELDPARLAQEVAILADRSDVTEELVRIDSHIGQARDLLSQDEPVGRRLEFLVQELGREFNTVGSKSQSADIARLVVEAKAELEKIREQVQNVE